MKAQLAAYLHKIRPKLKDTFPFAWEELALDLIQDVLTLNAPGVLHYVACYCNVAALERMLNWKNADKNVTKQYQLALAKAVHTPQKCQITFGNSKIDQINPSGFLALMLNQTHASLQSVRALCDTLIILEKIASLDRKYVPKSMWTTTIQHQINSWLSQQARELTSPSYGLYQHMCQASEISISGEDQFKSDPTLQALTRSYYQNIINEIRSQMPAPAIEQTQPAAPAAAPARPASNKPQEIRNPHIQEYFRRKAEQELQRKAASSAAGKHTGANK
jgi:hypothetical protein